MKKNPLKYFILGLLAFFLLATTAQAISESSIIGTVTVTPLKITLMARENILVNQKFNLKTTIENLGQKDINEITLTLALPSELALERGELERNLGTIKAGKKEIINWQLKALAKGDYTIWASASGIEQDTGKIINSSTSITIKVIKSRVLLFIYQFLEFWGSIFGR